MELPLDFKNLMRAHLGDQQAEHLFEGLCQPPTVSVRFNPRKTEALGVPALADAVPWCPDAFYLPERMAFTFDPLFHAGVYYVQDASSMYLAEVLRRYMPAGRPLAALDLCAAPGGKSTLLASHLPQGSVLVSNEPVRKRAQILAENMLKWCSPTAMDRPSAEPVTCLVTEGYPASFAHLAGSFDLILTDVPCSGEGMFRKDETAIREWSPDNVRRCVERQRDILTCILPTLRDGGLLVYSTCTFNRHEDEEQVGWLVGNGGMELLHERHFFPGRDRGEGIYMAALRKPAAAHHSPEGTASPSASLLPKLRRTLNVIAEAGEEGNDTRWQPTDSLLELDYAQAIAYLRREALHVAAPRGIVTVTYRGIPLGQAKSVGNRLNNLYPQEWRIRTTYSPTEPVPDFFP